MLRLEETKDQNLTHVVKLLFSLLPADQRVYKRVCDMGLSQESRFMKPGRLFSEMFCIVLAPLLTASCAEKRAIVHSGSSVETIFNASKRAIDDVGFAVVSSDRENGNILGQYDEGEACCRTSVFKGTRIEIKVKPFSGDLLQSEAEVTITPAHVNILEEFLRAMKNEVPDVKFVVLEE